MKTMKRIAALLLTLCLLIGLPMSVSAADSTTEDLVVEKVAVYDTNSANKIAVKFNKTIVSNEALKVYLAIYHEGGEDVYGYDWDTATGTCTAVYDSGSGHTSTYWSLDRPRQPDGGGQGFSVAANGYGFMANATDTANTLYKMEAVYRKVLTIDPNARFVINIKDATTDAQDGYIDKLVSADGTQKLVATHVNHEGVDCHEFEILRYNTITSVEAYDGRLVFRFSEPVAYNALDKVWIYLQRCDESGAAVGTYYVSARGNAVSSFGNPRFAGAGNTALALDFSRFEDLKSDLEANPTHTIRLTAKSDVEDTDGFITDVTSTDGYQLVANTTMDNADAFSITVDVRDTADELIMEDVKFYQDNQILITFNKPVTIDTSKQHSFFVYLYESRTIFNFTYYSLNEDGTYTIDTSGSGTKCEWACQTDLDTFGATGNQVLATLQGKVTVDQIKAITENSGYYLCAKIQENANETAHVVDSIWETGNPTNKLVCTTNNDNADRAILEISGTISGEAMLNGECFDTLDEALKAAETAENRTVVMLKNASADMVKVSAGVTLDLYGYNLTTDILMSFGHVIDSKDGQGKLVTSNDPAQSVVHLQPGNPDMPLYDTDGYRFFTYTVASAGPKNGTTSSISFGVQVIFANTDAYDLLATNDTATVNMALSATKNEKTYELSMHFSATTLETYSAAWKAGDTDNNPDTKPTLVLTVSGLKGFGSISCTPSVDSMTTLVNQVGSTLSYDVPVSEA